MNKGVAKAVKERKLLEIQRVIRDEQFRKNRLQKSYINGDRRTRVNNQDPAEAVAHISTNSLFDRSAEVETLKKRRVAKEAQLVSSTENKNTPFRRNSLGDYASMVGSLRDYHSQQVSPDAFIDGVDAMLRARKELGCCHDRDTYVDEDAIYAMAIKHLPDARLLNPKGYLKLLWDNFILLLVIFSVLCIPFTFAFQTAYDPEFQVLELTICSIFLLDMLATFNCAVLIKVEGVYLITRNEIALYYMRGWFFIDLISSIPIDIILLLSGVDQAELGLIRLLRFIRVSRIIKYLQNKTLNRYHNAAIGVLIIIGMCHTFGCFWWYLGNTNSINPDGYDSSWIELAESKGVRLPDASPFDDYIMSVYYAVVTLLTVGYGDIHPVNNRERVFAMVLMVVGAISFGYLISQVSKIIDSSDPEAINNALRITDFNSYLNESGRIPADLKVRAMKAFTYSLRAQKSSGIVNTPFFHDLPPSIFNPLVIELYKNAINSIGLFEQLTRQGHADFVTRIIVQAKFFLATRDEVILTRGELCDKVIFVMKGRVTFSSSNESGSLVDGLCSEGYYFGDMELFLNCTCMSNYSANVDCELLSIDFSVLNAVGNNYPESFAHFKSLANNRCKSFLDVLSSEASQVDDIHHLSQEIWMNGSVTLISESEAAALLSTSSSETGVKYLCCDNPDPNSDRHSFEERTAFSLLKSNWLLHPELSSLVLWQMCVELLIIYAVFVVTVQVAFSRTPVGSWRDMDRFLTFIFGMDVLIKFRVIYWHQGLEAYILNAKSIAERYIFSWFIIDVIAALPWNDLISAADNTNSVNILRLFKALRVFELGVIYRVILNQMNHSRIYLLDLAMLAFKIITLSHFVACLWWGVSASTDGQSWIDEPAMVFSDSLRYADLTTQYIISMYWALVSLTTLGYGDIFSLNTDNRVLAIFVLLVGASLFGYVLGYVGVVFSTLSSAESRRVAERERNEDVLDQHSVSPSVRVAYLDMLDLKFSQESIYNEEDFLRELPHSIMREIFLFSRHDLISQIPLFDSIENPADRYHLLRLLEVEYFSSDEIVIKKGSSADSIRFIIRGSCALYKDMKSNRRDTLHRLARVPTPLNDENSRFNLSMKMLDNTNTQVCDTMVAKIFPRNFFGHCSLLGGSIYPMTVKTTEAVCLCKLTESSLQDLNQSSPTLALIVQNALVKAIELQRDSLARLKVEYERFEFLADIHSISSFIRKRRKSSSAMDKIKQVLGIAGDAKILNIVETAAICTRIEEVNKVVDMRRTRSFSQLPLVSGTAALIKRSNSSE